MPRQTTRIKVYGTAVLTSNPIDMRSMMGSSAINVVLAGTAPSVAVTFTVSDLENGTYRTPYDTAGNVLGNIVPVGSEITASRWIQFDPSLGNWMKIVFTGSATNDTDTTVKAHLITQLALI